MSASPTVTRTLVLGTSGHASVLLDLLDLLPHFQVVGLLDGYRQAGERALGLPVLGSHSAIAAIAAAHHAEAVVIAVGDNFHRERLAQEILALWPAVKFPALRHPNAVIASSAEVQDGCQVLAGAIVGPACRVGAHCLLNTRASLDHESVMDSASSLAPGAITGGRCHVGRRAAIGIGATLKHGISIGDDAVVGAGAVVLRDLPGSVVAYGCPAKPVRARAPGDRYL